MTVARRALRLAGLLGLAGSLLACSCADSGTQAVAPTAGDLLRGDHRIQAILAPCQEGGFYDRDLSDLSLVLTGKLERSRPDPLKRAKEELGLMGEDAHPSLSRFFQRNYGDMMHTPLLENAVDAMAFNHTDVSHDLLLEATLHPQESVRRKAYGALGQHERASDFDVLAERLHLEQGDTRSQLAAVLHRVARERAEPLFLDWLESGENQALWPVTTPLLASSRDAKVARRCAVLFPRMDPPGSVQLAVAAASQGDDRALTFVRSELRHEGPQHRLAAVNAVRLSGLVDLLEFSVFEDADASIRALAVAAVGERGEPSDLHRTWLHGALNDPSPVVQGAALQALCAHFDPEGLARALVQLREEGGPLTSALQALRPAMRGDEAVARSAFEIVLERNALEEGRPLAKRTSTLKAFGQIPLPEAAQCLHDLGVAAKGESLEGLRPHDWLMIQASNTGVPGRTRLHEILLAVDDPLLRLDLIDAVASARDDLTRQALLPLVEDSSRDPLERLFLASVLVRCGPSWEVAPALKRVVFAMQGPEELEARRAMQCLLWSWY